MADQGLIARTLFGFLDRLGFDYCVVGDTRLYPDTISSDIDIVVPRDALPGIAKAVARFCRESDAQLVQLIQHEQTALYFVLAWADGAGGMRFLAPDICSDYFRGGRRLLTSEEILLERLPATDASRRPKGFYVPAPHIQFIYYLLKKVDKQELSDDQGDYLSDLWRSDAGGAWAQICRFWPKNADAELLAQAAASHEWCAVRRALARLRKELRRTAPRSLNGAIREYHRRAARVLQPTGLAVAFLGPDGSGKSSVITQVLADLFPVFRRVGSFHFRPRLFVGGKVVPLVTRPHELPARGTLGSLAKLVYLVFDYVSGWVLRVRPLLTRSALVLFDRYYHDVLVDPKRYRYGGPMLLAHLAGRCIPAPDLWVLLDAPAEVLQARKSEVPVEESGRQRRAYLAFAKRSRNAVVIDASRDFASVVSAAEREILRLMRQRIERRYAVQPFKENPVTARVLLFFCRWKVPVLSKLVRIVLNSDIDCRILSPIFMPHPYGIIIHAKAVVGGGVTIMQQVTVGSKNGDENAAPVIEDEAYIGAGARVLGDVRIGRRAVVCANAVVTRDIPPGRTVVGINHVVQGPSAVDAHFASVDTPTLSKREPMRAAANRTTADGFHGHPPSSTECAP